jgi:hypothetical protein
MRDLVMQLRELEVIRIHWTKAIERLRGYASKERMPVIGRNDGRAVERCVPVGRRGRLANIQNSGCPGAQG